jgi:DNA-binding LacI/PurR family transcriptional regulator
MQKRPPSMIDVGAFSGVSHQTVSRVLNNHKNVRESTRIKVLAAMSELGYKPNLAARALSNGRTTTIGVLGYNTTLYGPASTLHAIQSSARSFGYAVTLASLQAVDAELISTGIAELIDSGVDGIVIIAPLLKGVALPKNLSSVVPFVIVEGEDIDGFPSVNIDNFLGAKLAVEYLILLGHEKIAHISGPSTWYEGKRRKAGWSKALKDAKLKEVVCIEGDWSALSGYNAMKDIVKKSDATAVFIANDAMSLGALKALSELKIGVPDDISIVGFDDIPEAQYLIPGLTTVRQDFEEVGRYALEILIARINGEEVAKMSIAIRPEMIIRESTGQPAH